MMPIRCYFLAFMIVSVMIVVATVVWIVDTLAPDYELTILTVPSVESDHVPEFHKSPNRRPVKLGTFDNEEDRLRPEKSPEGQLDYVV